MSRCRRPFVRGARRREGEEGSGRGVPGPATARRRCGCRTPPTRPRRARGRPRDPKSSGQHLLRRHELERQLVLEFAGRGGQEVDRHADLGDVLERGGRRIDHDSCDHVVADGDELDSTRGLDFVGPAGPTGGPIDAGQPLAIAAAAAHDQEGGVRSSNEIGFRAPRPEDLAGSGIETHPLLGQDVTDGKRSGCQLRPAAGLRPDGHDSRTLVPAFPTSSGVIPDHHGAPFGIRPVCAVATESFGDHDSVEREGHVERCRPGVRTDVGSATASRIRAAGRIRHHARIHALNYRVEDPWHHGRWRPTSVPRGTVSPRG